MMKQYLEQFFKEYEWPEEAGKQCLDSAKNSGKISASADFWKKIWKSTDKMWRRTALPWVQNLWQRPKRGAESLGNMAAVLFVPVQTASGSLSAAWTFPKSLQESLFDLKWKAMECRKVYGVWGNFTQDWFAGFLRMERFTLGRLQFEIMKEAPSGCPKEWKALGRPFVNVHIPEAK